MATSPNQKDVSRQVPNMELDKSNRKESLREKVGDKMEQAGDKLRKSGAETIGNAIHKAGDKLEHSGKKSQ